MIRCFKRQIHAISHSHTLRTQRSHMHQVAATNWYHMQDEKPSLENYLNEAEKFAYGDYLSALALGRRVADEKYEHVLAEAAATGADVNLPSYTLIRSFPSFKSLDKICESL